MGLGIWAMHFIGMLALKLPIPVSYDLTLSVLSVFPAILACVVVFWMMNHKGNQYQLIIAGILLGGGIGSMHYIGMMAMRLNAIMIHDMTLFYLSILVAVILATIALKLQDKDTFKIQRPLFSAVVMGLATSVMHYSAMSAVNFVPKISHQMIEGIEPTKLIILVTVVVFLVLLIAFLSPKVVLNVSERKQAEQKQKLLFRENTFQRVALDKHAIVSISDVKGDITYANDLFCKVSGYSEQELIGKNHRILKSDIHPDAFFDDMWRTIANGHVWHGEIQNKAKNGSVYWVHSTIVPMLNEEGKPERYISMRTDITKNKQLEEKLKQLAHFDTLTGLPNRALFVDRFTQAIAYSKRHKTLLAICFIDLDNFKPVNDTFGHDIGDKLLIEVASRISNTIRDEDTASRQGGDEFALLLGSLDSPFHSEKMLERLNHVLAEPYLIDDNIITISASIGVALYPLNDADLDTLLRHSDQAMYQAKFAGRNRYHIFNAEQDHRTLQRQQQLEEIHQALTNKELCLYYQPKVNMKTGKVFGVEALIRWIHPEKGLIPPLDFLPLIEGTDLEIQVGGWVINEALQQLDSWQHQGIKLEVSINVSSHHLQSDAFFDQLNEAMDNHPSVDSQDLQLEILESSALGDLEAISGIIKSCQHVLGVNVALDDFGTGYSSLTHMKNLSANIIKIDQTFVRDLLDDPNDYSIIEGVIGLARAFGREVIAEGVETDAHGLMLLIMGCYEAQGYGISRPLPAADLPAWLADYTPNQYWIDYGKQDFTIEEQKITLLKLTTERWVDNVNNTLLSVEKSGSERLFVKCYLGIWLTRFEQGGTFDAAWLKELRQAHNVMFSLASELVDEYQAGDLDAAKAGISELERTYKTVSSILEQQQET
ncbi:MAG: EAL domain-containing protein [Piscirickettsiaceae bacterium]|nr:EAL domain-containing protein [Piscirickettsiaceae bacterium]